MIKNLLTIREAAEMIGVSIATLRRWDANGYLPSIRIGKGSHRLYRVRDIELLATDLFSLAKIWAVSPAPTEPKSDFFCPINSVFQARLHRMETEMTKRPELQNIFSLVSSITGEIGNNSFDHNLGSWPDIAGVFFGYDLNKKIVVLADRGQGILCTLKRVRKELESHEQALKLAFTEVVTGRAPEHRGNGLKYVRKIVIGYPISLFFQTGNAMFHLPDGKNEIRIEKTDQPIQGCLAMIKF